jgi:Zn-dependent protease with chaperone function
LGYLVHIVLALGAVALVETAGATGWRWPAAVLGSCAVPHLLLALARRQYLRGRFRSASLVYRLLSWSPPILQLAALGLFGWHLTVQDLVGGSGQLLTWPGPALALVLAPFLVFELLAIDARARIGAESPADVRRLRGFQARMFLSGLAPLALYVTIAWLIGSSEVARVEIEQVSLWGGLFAVGLLGGFILLLPWVLRATWDTERLPNGIERSLLEEVARRSGFRCRELLLWRTGGQMANAAVVGVGARHRLVLFSDALLAQLSPRELCAVFAHEIGHVARHHVPSFLAWALAFFLGADLAAGWFEPEGELLAALLLGGVLAIWYFGFGWLSRRVELDADLYSLEQLGDLEAMVGALEQVGSPHSRRLASWRHFSVADRVEFLRRAAADPAIGRRLRRRLRTFAATGATLAALAIGLQGIDLARAYPEESLTADLRLGRYAKAQERLERIESPDPAIPRLVERALALPAEQRDAGGFERAALEALESGDAAAAADLLALAAWRGREDLAQVADALLQGPSEETLDRLRAAPPDWQRAVRRYWDVSPP